MKENEMKNSYNVEDIKWSLMVNQLLDNVDINKMSQDNISELFLDNRKIIGSRIYLQKDRKQLNVAKFILFTTKETV